MTDETLIFRRCDLTDAPELLRVAQAAIATDTFYRQAFGFGPQDLDAYFRAYFRMVLTDPAAEVLALAAGERLVSCAAVSYHGFPCPAAGERFESDLHAALAREQKESFARFLAAYEELMTTPEAQARTEAQALWLFVEPAYRGAGLVAKMLRTWVKRCRPASVQVLCGLVNTGAPDLIESYRRIGFSFDRTIQAGELRLSRFSLQLDAAHPSAAVTQAAHEHAKG